MIALVISAVTPQIFTPVPFKNSLSPRAKDEENRKQDLKSRETPSLGCEPDPASAAQRCNPLLLGLD